MISRKTIFYLSTQWTTFVEPFLSDVLVRYPEVNIQIYPYGKDEICFISPRELVDEEFMYTHQPCAFYTLNTVNRPWFKVLLQGRAERLQELLGLMSGVLKIGCRTVFSSLTFLEILPRAVSKGSALKYLSSLPILEGRQIVAIGDYSNDRELLQNADVAIAPQNALPEVKALANYIVASNNEDAVADLIERILPEL